MPGCVEPSVCPLAIPYAHTTLAMPTPTRPALRYFGAKWRIAPWIIGHFAPHKVYVEPFAGGAGVLLRKPPSALEVYNDLDGEVVNFFRVLRNQPDELIRSIELTPFSRREWERAYAEPERRDPVERARRFYVRSWQAYGSSGLRPDQTGWRAEKTTARGKRLIDDWNETAHLYAVAERLSGVQIDCRDALEAIRFYDGPDTLMYLDPPYLAEVRERLRGYTCDMGGKEAHEKLAHVATRSEAMIVLSGYPSRLYRRLYEAAGWRRVEKKARTMASNTRTECLWLNPALQKARGADLFLRSDTA